MTASSSKIFKFNWNEKTGLKKILMIIFYSVLLYLFNIILWFIKWKYYKKWYLNQEMKEKDFLEEAEKEKKELEESYRESRRQTEERKLKENKWRRRKD